MDIGRKIKQLRVAQELTQGELADRTDLTKGFISQLENDQTSPSIETLTDILNVMGMTLGEFFHEVERPGRQVVFGKKDRVRSHDSSKDVDFDLLVPEAINRELDPALVTLKPGGRTVSDKMHQGEEFGYVLSGEVVLRLGKAEHRVRSGECFLFYPQQAHWVENNASRPAKLLWVTTPPTHSD